MVTSNRYSPKLLYICIYYLFSNDTLYYITYLAYCTLEFGRIPRHFNTPPNVFHSKLSMLPMLPMLPMLRCLLWFSAIRLFLRTSITSRYFGGSTGLR